MFTLLPQTSSPPAPGLTGQICRRCAAGKKSSSGGCRKRERFRGVVHKCFALSGNPIDTKVEDRRKFLLRYVQDVQPAILEAFQEHAPHTVADAMRVTIANMLGTLPPQFFSVTVSTATENLAQLMYSVLMTGYMFRNAQYRLDLLYNLRSTDEEDHGPAFAPAIQQTEHKDSGYAPGTQLTRVQGHVLRYRESTGTETIPADQYIRALEDEVAQLRQQVSRKLYARTSGNELLDLLKCAEPAQLSELTEGAGEDVLEAMNSFVQRLLGGEGLSHIESNVTELARMLFYLLVVGYTIRTMEVRFDMEQSLCLPPGPYYDQ